MISYLNWKWFGTLFLFASAVSGFSQDLELNVLATKLRDQVVKANKKVIAVWDLSNSQGYGPEFSEYLADELSIRLVQDSPGFRVVTRNRLDQIMKEKGLKYAHEFDQNTFQEIGKLAGADAVITGSFQVLTSTVHAVFQVLDVKDGTIITGTSGQLPKTKDLEAYLQFRSPAVDRSGGDPSQQPSGSPSTPPGPSPSSKKGQPHLPVEEAGFVFEYPHCKVTSNAVNCWLLVKSPGKDQSMRVSALNGTESSFLYDQNGISYPASQATVGNITNTRIDYEYIRDIAVRVDLTFPVNRSITSIAALKLLCFANFRFVAPTFRDVPLD